MDLRFQQGFLGTGAPLLADLNLLAYIFLLLPLMVVGFIFARRKKFEPHHKITMTTITLINWGLILFIMAARYGSTVAQELPAGLAKPPDLIPTIHLITGGLAQIVATYLVIRMWFEDVLPEWSKVKHIKRYMRFTLAMWITTAVLGIVTYFLWYVAADPSIPGVYPPPIATPEVTPEVTPDVTPEVVPAETLEVAVTPAVDPAVQATINALLTLEAMPTFQPAAPVATAEVGASSIREGLQVVQTVEIVPDPEPEDEHEDEDDDNSGSGSSGG